MKNQKHTKNFLKEAIINKNVENGINDERLKDIIKKRIKEHVEKFNYFTIIFCWKKYNIEYKIAIV